MSSSTLTLPAPGYIEPCVPTAAKRSPKGFDWIFELKYDGYRLMARKAGADVRLYSRRGADFTRRFPRVVEAVRKLQATSALLDAEAIVYDQHGMPDFNLIHSKEYDRYVTLVAFDLLEANGEDIRPLPLEERKRRLRHLVSKVRGGIEYNEHLEGDGEEIFRHACRLKHEGIVAKRRDLGYESGRSKRWLKVKNPDSPAARRTEEGTF